MEKPKVKQPLPPFSCIPAPNFAETLTQFNGSIAFSTFQAGKLCVLSAKDENFATSLLRTMPNCMGFDYDNNELAVASGGYLCKFRNYPQLNPAFESKTVKYDAVYLEMSRYFLGNIDAHDVSIGNDGIYIVYTHNNSIYRLQDGKLSEYWTPEFIENNGLEDRCHLNGLAIVDGKPKYASMMGTGNEKESWRKTIPGGGCIIDIETNEVVAEDLQMPHSPRMYNKQLLVLESAQESLMSIDLDTKEKKTVAKLNGFLRGMDIVGDYALIGSSKLRKNNSIFNGLPIADKKIKAGVYIVHIPTGIAVSQALYENTVDEIFEVKFLPNLRPNIIPVTNKMHSRIVVLDNGQCYWSNTEKTE